MPNRAAKSRKQNRAKLNKKWAKDKIVANGMSFSKLILNEAGIEDSIRSQRTEFRVKVDSAYIIEKLRNVFGERKNEAQ